MEFTRRKNCSEVAVEKSIAKPTVLVWWLDWPRGSLPRILTLAHDHKLPLNEAFAQLSAALADRYRLERELGEGGMATVYLASDVRHERQVAVKVLRPDLSASIGSERFLQEIRIAAKLSHPHILPLHDSGEANGLLYYVMPYVAGESLRQRIIREGELPITDAARILRDVSDALGYAHEHGVVHRDIKPENILLTGRHALVADFGVAKALSEATGKNKLTTAGVALGTPAYMAPEQAVADPHVDHRADIYALGVVGYEMIVGSPPFTGGSPQQVLASQVTELPRPVTARRPAVPPLLATAIMRCLEKKPADRWQSADDLMSQIEAAQTTTGGSTPTDTRPIAAAARVRSRWPVIAAVSTALAALLALGVLNMTSRSADAGPAVTLRDRTQLTFTGRIQAPAISPDGKQLAYMLKDCSETRCSYSVDVQDVGGTTTRRVLAGANSVYFIDWSPDRRNLLITGTINGAWGTHLVSLLGGPARRVGPGGGMGGSGATFYAGGDSLLIAPSGPADSVAWVRVATLDGSVRDSIGVPTRGARIASVTTIPGTRWIEVTFTGRNQAERRIIDRNGREASRQTIPFGVSRASSDAVWLAAWGDLGELSAIVRTAFDSSTGRLSTRSDTVYGGNLTGFSVNAAGTAVAVDDGTYQHSVYALDVGDALAGTFPEQRRLMQASTELNAKLSPDGQRVLVRRTVPTPDGSVDFRFSILPFDGGAEIPVALPSGSRSADWVDSGMLALYRKESGKLRLSRFDITAASSSDEASPPDSTVWDWIALPGGGWAWIEPDGRSITISRGGQTRSFPKPPWYEHIQGLSAARPNELVFRGWNLSTSDTMGVSVLSLKDWTARQWLSLFADDGRINALTDGSILFHLYETAESATLIHIAGPGSPRRLGTIPRPVSMATFSDDIKRSVLTTRDYFGDVWLMRIVPSREK